MHAYLLVSQNSDFKSQINEISKKLDAKVMEFPLAKIEDVRELNKLIRLTFKEPALIVCEKIDQATTETLNAFLKNLEEPQENIYFALTASSVRKVLPTIVSRCQIIKTLNPKPETRNFREISDFLAMTPSQMIVFFDKIKDREKAIGFIESLIFSLHDKGNLTNMEILLKTRTCLKANGNVNLQLTNLATHWNI